MPTATLIRCATWRGGSTSVPSSVAKDAVPSDGGGIGHHQEVVNCNSKDASIIIPPRMKKKVHKKKPVVKESQPGVKASVKTKKRKRCSFDGCNTQMTKTIHQKKSIVKKIQPGVKASVRTRKRKRCSYEGCTKQVVKGGVCVTHGAEKKRCSLS
jgi:hypothetical protein